MAHTNNTQRLARTEEALTVLFCLIDDAYAHLNPNGKRYESIKRLADSVVITLALLQQLRGVESERSFLRDTERSFSQLFLGVVGLHPSSLHRRVRKLRHFLEPLRRQIVSELVGDPEPRLVDSTLLAAACRAAPQAGRSVGGLPGSGLGEVGFFWRLRGEAASVVRYQRGTHLLRTDALQNVAEVRLTEELLAEANLGDDLARRLFGDLAYRSETLGHASAECGISLVSERADQHGRRQRIEIALSSLKRVFGLGRRQEATTLVGLATRILRRRSAPTPKDFTSTGCWAGRRDASRSCGHENLATHI